MRILGKMTIAGMLWLLTVIQATLVHHMADAVHGAPPKMAENVETKFRIPVGQKNFRLVCPVLSMENEMMMIEWTKNDDQVEWDSRYKLGRDNRELRMKNVRVEDSGRYQCQATNGFGHQSIKFLVHVFDPNVNDTSVKDKIVLTNSSSSPSFLIDMDLEWHHPVQVNRGGRLEIACPARGNPMPQIKWYKNNMLLQYEAPAHIASFVLDPVKMEHSGDYRCLVENRLGSIDYIFKVIVGDFFQESTRIDDSLDDSGLEPIIDLPYNISVKVGHTAQFQCKAKSNDSPLIKWLKEVDDPIEVKAKDPNATLVSTNGMHLLVLDQKPSEPIIADVNGRLFTNRLVIPSVTKSHAGRYICVVTSTQGKIVYKSAQLNVIPSELMDVDLPGEFVWILIILGVIFMFILVVVCAIMFLRRFQEPTSPKDNKPPPPPRIPPPVAPAPYTPTLNRSFNHDMTFDKTRSPMISHDVMFKHKMGGMGVAATLDRSNMNVHRHQRGYDEMSNFYDCGSPQPYWPRNNTIYTPNSGNYRTLEMGHTYNGRPHPSLYSEDSTEHDPFMHNYRR